MDCTGSMASLIISCREKARKPSPDHFPQKKRHDLPHHFLPRKGTNSLTTSLFIFCREMTFTTSTLFSSSLAEKRHEAPYHLSHQFLHRKGTTYIDDLWDWFDPAIAATSHISWAGGVVGGFGRKPLHAETTLQSVRTSRIGKIHCQDR